MTHTPKPANDSTQPPAAIKIIGWIFILSGAGSICIAFLSGGVVRKTHEQPVEFWLTLGIRFLAIVAGAFLLLGSNWGRWLLAIWMTYHIILSLFHSPFELLIHGLLFSVIFYFLFRPEANHYFRRP